MQKNEYPKNSRLCVGEVRHSRYNPREHHFSYQVFMVLLDLDEVDSICGKSLLWGKSWWHLARYKREDFHGNPKKTLKSAVKETVLKESGLEIDGKVLMLANLRYFFYNMNPLVTYYCYDTQNRLCAIVAEVNNTPWGESHAYVLPCDPNQGIQQVSFEKVFTVSPFNPLNMTYYWRSNDPINIGSEKLEVHIENFQEKMRIFDASMVFEIQDITPKSMNRILLKYPFMTIKVIYAIYWQALKLYLKSVKFLGKDKRHKFDDI